MLSIHARTLSRRLIGGLLAVTLLTSCGPGGITNLQQDITLAAQERLKRTLAGHYTREFGNGISTVVTDLAQPGGYLDNPLVRILLPPPLGIALGVARDLQADPQAAVLTTLMNRAAEQVVTGAAPILQKALSQITPSEAYRLLDGGGTAGTDYLKAKTSANLRETLAPQIVEKLAGNGALDIYQDVYGAMIATQQATAADVVADPTAPPHLAPSELDEYVTEQTIDGMFKVLGAHETRLRENLDASTGGLLPSVTKPTLGNTAVDTAPAPVQAPVKEPDQDLIEELNRELAREPSPEPPLDPNLIGPVAPPSEAITPAATPTRELDVPSENN